MNEMLTWTAGQALREGWQALRNNAKVLLGAAALIYVFFGAFSIVGLSDTGMVVEMIVGGALGPPIAVGFAWMCLKAVRGEKPILADLFHPFRQFAAVWAAYVLLMVITFFGLGLFIIPGVIWGLKYYFTPIAVVDQKKSVGGALSLSAMLSDGQRGEMLWLALLIFAQFILQMPLFIGLQKVVEGEINWTLLAAGALPDVLASLLLYPLTMTAFMFVYDKLATDFAAGQQELPANKP